MWKRRQCGVVDREEIRWAYRMLFGREPEDEQAYASQSLHADVPALREALMRSPEGLSHLRAHARAVASSCYFNYFQPLLVFIHMEKTGGTSLYEALVAQLGGKRSSSPHLSFLPEYTLSELNQSDFISGHFSFQDAMALPRMPKTCITMFREPVARLISFYRFHRAHPAAARGDPTVRLAQDLGPVEFFRHPDIIGSTRVDHLYLHTFAPVPPPGCGRTAAAMSQACRQATERISALDAFGLTEDMDRSARLIGARIGIDLPASIARIHATDMFHGNAAGFAVAETIAMSDELLAVMMPLVKYDLKLFAHASRVFRERLALLDGVPAPGRFAFARLIARMKRR